METPSPFDLNEAIRCWQQNLSSSPAFKAENLEELASHLRASVQKLKATGLSEEEAFLAATQRIGERGPLEQEFAKVNPVFPCSLPMFLFRIVALIYLLQVTSSLAFGVLTLRSELWWRHGRNLFLPPIREHLNLAQVHGFDQMDQMINSQHEPSRPLVLGLTALAVFLLILGQRLATGKWKFCDAFLSSFKRPIRNGLGLAGVGLVITLLPEFLPRYLPDIWGGSIFVGSSGDFNALASVNTVLVLTMMLLSRWGLRNMSPAGGPPHKRAMRCSC
jgi:hypothetical protein